MNRLDRVGFGAVQAQINGAIGTNKLSMINRFKFLSLTDANSPSRAGMAGLVPRKTASSNRQAHSLKLLNFIPPAA